MKISLTDIGKRLMRARTEKGLSIENAATLTGYSVPTLRRFEQKGLKDIIKLADICGAYDADLADVLFGPASKYPTGELPPEVKRYILYLAEEIKKADGD